MTHFDGFGNESWLSDSVSNVTGTMNTTGGYIYADDYGFGAFGHGPFRYHTLSSLISVSQFISLEAELEVDMATTPEMGNVFVMLYDDSKKEVMALSVGMFWNLDGEDRINAFARWSFENGTSIETPVSYYPQEPYFDTLRLYQNETGIFADIPRFGNFSILDSVEVDSSRTIKYVALYITATMSFTPCNVVRVHELLLKYGVDTIPPIIQGPDEIHYDEFSTGNTITWNVSESNPSTYSIFVNGTPDSEGDWDSSNLTIIVDNHSLGVYNYTLLVADTSGNIASDSVFVFVYDGDAPNLTNPEDLEFYEGATGVTIVWIATDEHPERYEILIDGAILRLGLWNTTGEPISVALDSMEPGDYDYTCIVYDVGDNSASDTVLVEVIPASTTTTTTMTTSPTTTTTTGVGPPPNDFNLVILGLGGVIALAALILAFKRRL
ncbi:MAG: hypothetical protein JSW61_02160 [Candidatus Thorarchaeota archaeon]|nr:MAG: hypothetical protein JSW61_02160 [Candidatus Thorarchaeota archaeon]